MHRDLPTSFCIHFSGVIYIYVIYTYIYVYIWYPPPPGPTFSHFHVYIYTYNILVFSGGVSCFGFKGMVTSWSNLDAIAGFIRIPGSLPYGWWKKSQTTLGCIKPCKGMNYQPQLVSRISEASTVWKPFHRGSLILGPFAASNRSPGKYGVAWAGLVAIWGVMIEALPVTACLFSFGMSWSSHFQDGYTQKCCAIYVYNCILFVHIHIHTRHIHLICI